MRCGHAFAEAGQSASARTSEQTSGVRLTPESFAEPAGGLTAHGALGPGPSCKLICNARVTCMRGDVVLLARDGLEEDTALLWRALADPTRRKIMDLLRERPRVTGEIAAQFPISRIAVLRHLE